MRRRAPHSAQEPGQDSFLDIVANLVGILIILVMVVGVRAKDALVAVRQSTTPEPAALEEIREQAEIARGTSQALETDVHRIQGKIRRLDLEIAYRRRERDRVLQLLTAVERGLEEQRGELGEAERNRYELAREMSAARGKLLDLKRSREAIESREEATETIEHLPTPMAKTVFGKELHFRLLDGRLAYVPMDELVEQLKAEAPQKLWKLKQAPQITETLGPIDGFRMKYTLEQVAHTVPTRTGMAVQRGVQLDRFVLLPVRDDLGEPLDEALREGGALDVRLAGERPRETTVTVWVYPNSFQDFRRLKEHLFQRGFLTAGRPLPADTPIGGSPDGSHSAAQ